MNSVTTSVEIASNSPADISRPGRRKAIARAVKAAVAGAVLLGGAHQVMALGLGQLESSSYVGEPLSAEIEVLDSSENYSPQEIRVRQVSTREASEKLNLDLITNHFRLAIKPYSKDGRLFIKIDSKLPINEPFIDFLLELSWSGGQVYREYTLLMDLPPAVAAPTASQSKPSKLKPPQEAAAPAPARKGPEQSPVRFSPGSLGGDYQVRSGDTLSHIAEQWRLGSQHTLRDTEQWLFDNNAHAFLNGNRNQLMLGAKLHLPSADNLPGSGTARFENRIPVEPLTEPLSVPPAQESAAADPAAAIAEPSSEPKGTLRLGNNSTIGTDELQQKTSEVKSNEEIRDLIHVTQETADRIIRENEELKRRIQNIEDSEYIQNMEKLVVLQRDEIEQLRQGLEQREQTPATAELQSLPTASGGTATTVDSTTATTIVQNNNYSVWFWVLSVLSALMGMLIAALVSFRLGQKSRTDSEPLAVPTSRVEPPVVENPDVAELGPIKSPDDLGDEEIIPLELEDPADLENVLDDMDLLPEDEAMLEGISNREPVSRAPASPSVNSELTGLSSVRLPSLVAEELQDDKLSFDLELNEDFTIDDEAMGEELGAGAAMDNDLVVDVDMGDDSDLNEIEAGLLKDNRDEVDDLISTAMIFASFDDYDKAEELLINESAHYIDEPRIIKALEQLASARKKAEGGSDS